MDGSEAREGGGEEKGGSDRHRDRRPLTEERERGGSFDHPSSAKKKKKRREKMSRKESVHDAGVGASSYWCDLQLVHTLLTNGERERERERDASLQKFLIFMNLPNVGRGGEGTSWLSRFEMGHGVPCLYTLKVSLSLSCKHCFQFLEVNISTVVCVEFGTLLR